MTDPSPQEELRTAIAVVITRHYAPREGMDIDAAAEELLPLFAARVAAIEAEREAQREGGRIERLNSDRWAARALKAEADLAAMTAERDKALEAWGTGECCFDCPHHGFTVVELAGRDPGEMTWEETFALLQARTDKAEADLTAAQERIAELTAEVQYWTDAAAGYAERVAAERKQAAAQAFAEGWSADYPYDDDGFPLMPINPYTGEYVVEWSPPGETKKQRETR